MLIGRIQFLNLMIRQLLLLFSFSVYCCLAEPDTSCSSGKRDIVLVIDASNATSDKEFQCVKKYLTKTINFLTVNPDNRIALIVAAGDARLAFSFGSKLQLIDMISIVKQLEKATTAAVIGKSLKLVLDELVPTMRQDAFKVVFLVTLGASANCRSLQKRIEQLKEASVTMAMIGIGSKMNTYDMTKLVSTRFVSSFSNVREAVGKVKSIIEQICAETKPPNQKILLIQQDIVFLLDSSESLTNNEYMLLKSFIIRVLSLATIGLNQTRAAMISFSEENRIDFDFGLSDQKKIFDIINTIEKFGSVTGIGSALHETLMTFMPKRRAGVPFNVVLITDGSNNMFPRPIGEANLLKGDGANIITFGIGSATKPDELNAIASENNAIFVESFDELRDKLEFNVAKVHEKMKFSIQDNI